MPTTPPAASPSGDLEINFGAVMNLFGATDVGGRRFLPTWNNNNDYRRHLQGDDQSFNIDVTRFMSFELVRGDGGAPEKRLRFTPKLGEFSGSSMKIKFDF